MNIRAAVAVVCLIVGFAGRAEAGSTVRVEVREPTKSRLVSADVWIRTKSGKLIRKVFASGGRAQITQLPSGTLNLEVRSRAGNLSRKTRVYAQPNRLVKVTVKLRPAPPPKPSATSSTPRKPRHRSVRASDPTAGRGHRPGRLSSVRRAGTRPGLSNKTPTGHDRRASSSVSRTPRRTGQRPTRYQTTSGPRTGTAGGKDWGRGRRRVCRGDVLDGRGRRVSGRVTIRRGSQVIGFAKVTSGYFSLYDLTSGTYRLRFTDTSGRKHASTTMSVIANRLIKVVLRAR